MMIVMSMKFMSKIVDATIGENKTKDANGEMKIFS